MLLGENTKKEVEKIYLQRSAIHAEATRNWLAFRPSPSEKQEMINNTIPCWKKSGEVIYSGSRNSQVFSLAEKLE